MKKVGIMSMHRIINYGSFLQAYGLYKTIKELGNDVCFIDYHYEGYLENPSKHSLFYKLKKNIDIFEYVKKKKLYLKFKQQINENLKKMNVTANWNYSHNIDTLVIGSDEVFNCMQGYPVGYSLELFGKNYEDKKIISYAASFGFTTLEKIKDHNKENELSKLLNNFKNISVRDINSSKIVETLCGINPSINVDPVIMADFSDMLKTEKKLDNYIIVYAYQGRLTKNEEKYIKKFAKEHNKKIVSLGFYQKIADYNLAVSPFEVIGYFKYADFIITDTFHGTVFSIKSNAKFCTIIRNSNRNKLGYLLEMLKQSDRIVERIENINELYNKEIDYSETNKIIEEERKRAIKYLKENL